MKYEHLYVDQILKVTLDATFSTMGEEAGQQLLDDFATQRAATILGLYAMANPEAIIHFDSVEYEEPCEDHPDYLVIFLNLNVEE